MSGRKAALEALAMAAEVERRLLAAGIPPSRLPEHRAVFEACWPVARKLVKHRRQVAVAHAWVAYCEQRAALLEPARDECVGRVAAYWRDVAGQELRRLVAFDPVQWHLALQPSPAPRGERWQAA